MFYISEKEYNIKLEKIKRKNESKKRLQLLKKEKKKIKQSSKMSTSNKVLFSAIMAVVLFTIICLYIQCRTSMEVSSTLITLWYSFWTVEIVSLAGIKVSKVFKDYQSNDDEIDMGIDETTDAVG